jgi:hypothetical protein
MAKKVLVVLSGYGYWGEEVIGPLEALDPAEYGLEYSNTACSDTGGRDSCL